ASQPTLSQIVSCLSDYDPKVVPVPQAHRIIRDFIAPVDAVEMVAIRSALDRVLARDIISPINVPSHDNSAMDGYAVQSADLDAATPVRLEVVGSAFAGRAWEGKLSAGQCLRIMTGAVMPPECDTVVPQEF